MTTDRPEPAAHDRAVLTLTLPLTILRRLEPYAAKRQRTALIEAAIRAELARREQEQEPQRA